MRLVASDRAVKEIQITEDGPKFRTQKDGTIHVPDFAGKWLKKSGDFAQAGIHFQGLASHFCPACGRENVYRDSCGGCGWKAEKVSS